jgi:ribonuclease P protein component
VKQNFGKEYKLCSKILIDQLFDSGFRVQQFPFQAIILPIKLNKEIPFQVLISVPKKKFKKAVHRNYLKRVTRELIRKNKVNLETLLFKMNIQLAICIMYTSNETLDYQLLEIKVSKLMDKIHTHVETLT